MENLGELTIDQLYKKVMDQTDDLLEYTLRVLTQISRKAEEIPESATTLLSLAQPIRVQYDVGVGKKELLQTQWGLWQSLSSFEKKSQAKAEQVKLVELLRHYEVWNQMLKEIGGALQA